MKTACISLLAIATLIVPSVHAQQVPQQFTDASGKPIYYTIYDTVPGIPYPVQDSYETMGMRQAKANNPVAQGTLMETYTGLSPAWVGIATALDTMAARGNTQQILSPSTVVPQIQSSGFNDRASLLAYRMRVQASQNSLDVLQAKSVVFSGDTQAEMRDATREAAYRRAEVDRCIAASQAADPSNWSQAQANLADAYNRYAAAATRVEQIAAQ